MTLAYTVRDAEGKIIKEFHTFGEAFDYAIYINIRCEIMNEKTQSVTLIGHPYTGLDKDRHRVLADTMDFDHGLNEDNITC